jgi:hypothetical protein
VIYVPVHIDSLRKRAKRRRIFFVVYIKKKTLVTLALLYLQLFIILTMLRSQSLRFEYFLIPRFGVRRRRTRVSMKQGAGYWSKKSRSATEILSF